MYIGCEYVIRGFLILRIQDGFDGFDYNKVHEPMRIIHQSTM